MSLERVYKTEVVTVAPQATLLELDFGHFQIAGGWSIL